ncbi:MAG TPA: glycosyltransferase [Bacteroidia bacterium]|jgi:glycosyltransferase involved in cell wall biosynthesis|nr:glycosyltransferase [Bacteroidia bacterium]
MKVLLLADCNSVHVKKWGMALVQKGIEVMIFSLTTEQNTGEWNKQGVKVISVPFAGKRKLTYPLALLSLKKVIIEFNPDIVHAHYASSYGLLGRLCKFHPFVLSVWGSDVFEFPLLRKINKGILTANFKAADKILSTSHIMAKEIGKYTDKKIEITPFGIDTKAFAPMPATLNKAITIGTIKSLEHIYGQDILIRACAYLVKKLNIDLNLVIAGAGSEHNNLEKLATSEGIADRIEWLGFVKQSEIPKILSGVDIFVNVSRQESFGVSIIEAMACEKPVIVSDVGGLPEIVTNGKNGICVPPDNAEALAAALKVLIENKTKRIELGKNARAHVIANYEWNNGVDKMMTIYREIKR